jgi:hypothetical protein
MNESRLTAAEADLLRYLLAPSQLEPFRRQLSGDAVARRGGDGQLYFSHADAAPTGGGCESLTNPIAEARYLDDDGIFVSYLLFQRDGSLYFLDVLKDAPVPIVKRFPPLAALQRIGGGAERAT